MSDESTNTNVVAVEQASLSQESIEALRSACKQSLFFLCRAVLGFKDLDQKIHKPICEELQNEESNRDIIVMPRTWFKSSIGSIGYPIWRAINDSNVRVLVCQNTFSNAVKKLSSIKQIFEKNALFRALFPALLPDTDARWSSDVLTVRRDATYPEGTFEAAGTGTAVTSRHYDVIIEDDTVAPEKDSMDVEMQTPTALEIEKAIGWHRLATPLLIHPLRSKIVIIGTRWCEEDLIGYVLENFKNYHVITRAVREKDGKPATKEEGGLPAWPERFDEEVLEEVEKALGPWMFCTLMMNLPTSASNAVFRLSWIKFFDSVPVCDLVCCTTHDPAATDKEATGDPDYSVSCTTGVNPSTGHIYILDYIRERMNPGRAVDTFFEHYDMYHPVRVRCESTAYQRTLKYWVEQEQKRRRKFFSIEQVPNAHVSKVDRIKGMQPFFANGMISMRSHMDALQRELLGFNGQKDQRGHDDVIDALSLHIPFWNDVLLQVRQKKEEKLLNDPFSGESILNSVLKRSTVRASYPYDIGNMKDRLHQPFMRVNW